MADDENLLGQVKKKLIEAKQRWAKEGRLLTGEVTDPAGRRLPPGQRVVKDWPVLDLGVQPDVPLSSWRLAVGGLVENPVDWSWTDFDGLPKVEEVSDIHCVTAWSRYDNRWLGVSARHILGVVRPTAEARHVIFHSHDGYTTNVRLEVFADEDVLLATHHDGVPLERRHGGPVRVVIPKWYFWKSAKWVRRIEFVADDRRGFWEVRGYHNEGDPWKEERYGF